MDAEPTCLSCISPSTDFCEECGKGYCAKHLYDVKVDKDGGKVDKDGDGVVTLCGKCRWRRIKESKSDD